MVSVDKAVIARIQKNGNTYEILVDCEQAMAYREGKSVSLRGLLAVDEVFKDSKKGLRAGNLAGTFGTEDIEKIADEIIRKGEVQLTQEYREKLTKEMKNRIVNYISMSATDTRTNSPVPPQRVELAIEQIKFSANPFGSVESQAKEVIEKLRPILPMSTEMKMLKVTIGSRWASKAYNLVSRLATIKSDSWLNDGSWTCEVTLLGGKVGNFINEINSLTQGNAEIIER